MTELETACGTSFRICCGKTAYELQPLTPNDLALAQSFLRSRRFAQFLESTRSIAGVNLPDAARASAMSAIMMAPIRLADIFECNETQLYLLWLSAGKKTSMIPFDAFCRSVESSENTRLMKTLFAITGLEWRGETESADGEAPLGETTTTKG